MPVQAIVLRRHCDGRACRPSSSSAETSDSTWSSSTSRTRSFCIGVVRTRVEPCASATSAIRFKRVPDTRPTLGAAPTKKRPSFWRKTPTWSAGVSGAPGVVEVDERALQVLGLEHLAELLDAPVGDQELQASPRAQTTVAVVAEDAGDALPQLRDLVDRHPGTEALGEMRVRRQAAADQDVEAGAVLGVDGPDERDVVGLRHHVVAGVPADRRLVLAREVREGLVADVPALDGLDGGGGIDDLVLGDARDGAAEDDARAVAARFLGGQPDGLEPFPDVGTSMTSIQCSWMF